MSLAAKVQVITQHFQATLRTLGPATGKRREAVSPVLFENQSTTFGTKVDRDNGLTPERLRMQQAPQRSRSQAVVAVDQTPRVARQRAPQRTQGREKGQGMEW